MSTTKSDFAAAEEIKGILHGRDKAEQERIVRWVCESLGLMVQGAGPVLSAAPGGPLPSSASVSAPVGIAAQTRDIRSFVEEKKPRKDVQFAAVAAYYYLFVAPLADRKPSITPEDLQEAGRHARGYSFKNPRATLNNAVMLGYFDRADGAFKLNAVGENLVAMALPGKQKDRGASASSRRKPRRRGGRKRRQGKEQKKT